MSAAILFWSLSIAQMLLALAMACAVYRMIKGPRAQDRVRLLDAPDRESLWETIRSEDASI